MPNELDSVDRALHSLAGRQWPGSAHNHQLETRIMQEFDTHKPATLFSRHRILIPALAILILGSLGFAAAGGIQLVRSLFVTTSINGEVVDVSEVILDEGGRGTFTIPIEPTDGLETLEISMEGEYVADDGTTGDAGAVSISLEAEAAQGSSEVEVEILVEEEEDQEDE